MPHAKIGVIGGTGLYGILNQYTSHRRIMIGKGYFWGFS